MPSFVKDVPVAAPWTKAIVEELLLSLHIHEQVAIQAMKLAHRRWDVEGLGMEFFSFMLRVNPPLEYIDEAKRQPAYQKEKPQSPGDERHDAIRIAKLLEEKFNRARRDGDQKAMEKFAKEYYDLLGRYPGKNKRARGGVHILRDTATSQRTHEEIMNGAPNLARVVRAIGPLDAARLNRSLADYLAGQVRADRLQRAQRRGRR
jgi:hypothetical protein